MIKPLYKFYDLCLTKRGFPKLLHRILIEPTNRCQLDCITCYRKGRAVGDMSWDTFLLAMAQIKQIKAASAITLNFAGEPLLHPKIVDMVSYVDTRRTIRGKKYVTGFSTNGLLLNDDMQDALCDQMDWINISMDGMGEMHESHRKGSDWNLVSTNARDFLDMPRDRLKISVNITMTDQSLDEVSDFKKEWKDADRVIITSRHNEDMRVVRYGEIRATESYCWQIYHGATVMWNGDVTSCCSDLKGINKCGNIYNKSLGDIIQECSPGPLCKPCNVWGPGK
jgi:sulfatase maturation enzyme AslB (radical SAM superfamily)